MVEQNKIILIIIAILLFFLNSCSTGEASREKVSNVTDLGKLYKYTSRTEEGEVTAEAWHRSKDSVQLNPRWRAFPNASLYYNILSSTVNAAILHQHSRYLLCNP